MSVLCACCGVKAGAIVVALAGDNYGWCEQIAQWQWVRLENCFSHFPCNGVPFVHTQSSNA